MDPYAYVELRPGGDDVFVDISNRLEFVDLFIKHALYYSCREAVDEFIRGILLVTGRCRVLSSCTHFEVCLNFAYRYITCCNSYPLAD